MWVRVLANFFRFTDFVCTFEKIVLTADTDILTIENVFYSDPK